MRGFVEQRKSLFLCLELPIFCHGPRWTIFQLLKCSENILQPRLSEAMSLRGLGMLGESLQIKLRVSKELIYY